MYLFSFFLFLCQRGEIWYIGCLLSVICLSQIKEKRNEKCVMFNFGCITCWVMIRDIEYNICFSIFWIYWLNNNQNWKRGKKSENEKLPGTSRRLDWELGDWMSQLRRPCPVSGDWVKTERYLGLIQRKEKKGKREKEIVKMKENDK